MQNRSIPRGTVIPEIPYADIGVAAAWLAHAFGFTLRLRVADHRIQLNVGPEGGAVVLVEEHAGALVSRTLVRVEDADAHHARASRAGARILAAPETHPFGERQYSAEDLAGHRWTFSQTVADAAPESWGGISGAL